MDRAAALSQEAPRSGARHGLDLAHDRQRDLLRSLGPEVETGRCEEGLQRTRARPDAFGAKLREEVPGEIRADLVLSDGGRAFAALHPFDVAWLEAREGDIVWVRQAASAACF